MTTILLSCSDDFETEGDFYQWINDAENGFVKIQHTNNFLFKVKYLPPSYLAFLELKKGEEAITVAAHQNILREFQNSKTFTLSIEHAENSVDPTYYDVWDAPQYRQRIHDLNFNMGEHISLVTDTGEKLKPVLASMENIYQLENKKIIYLVFPNTNNVLNEASTLDLVFEDVFFKTGINHFQFTNRELEELPQFNFIEHGNK